MILRPQMAYAKKTINQCLNVKYVIISLAQDA